MGLQDAIGRALGVLGIMTVIFTSTCTVIAGDLSGRWSAIVRCSPALQRSNRRHCRLSRQRRHHRHALVPDHTFLPLAAVLVLLVGLRLRLLRFDQEPSRACTKLQSPGFSTGNR
jgi:hypothetical protein